MTDTKELRQRIKDSGLKLNWIAKRCGLSYQGFLNKVDNKTDFTAPQILILKELLNLKPKEVESIFFTTK